MARRTAGETPSKREWLTVQEILDELGVPRRTWQRWRALGRAPQCVKLPNGELRVRRDHFDAWLAELQDTVA